MISEVGAEVALTRSPQTVDEALGSQAVELSLMDEQIAIAGTVSEVQTKNGFPVVTIQFAALPLAQQRRLVALLFCRPGQWQSRCAPNELQSLWLILKSVLQPRFLFDRQVQAKPVMVSKV